MVRLHEIVDAIMRECSRWRRPLIYLLGDVDTGKTTIMHSLVDGIIGRRKVALLDADVGQSTLGPPLTISLGLLDPDETRMRMVGQAYIPGFRIPRYLNRFLHAERRLVKAARREADMCIVDSVGFVEGVGSAIKLMEIDALNPDLVVALQREKELEAVLDGIRARALRFPPPKGVRRKTLSERRAHRNRKFVEYFAAGRARRLAIRAELLEAYRLVALLRGRRFLGFGSLLRAKDDSVELFTPVSGAVDGIEALDLRVHPQKGEI